jgi:hypothetical protein
VWIVAVALALVVLALWVSVPRFVANFVDYRARLVAAVAHGRESPQRPDETEEQHAVRMQWHVLTTLGLPPVFVVRHWLRSGNVVFVPPSYMIDRYLSEWAGRPLGDGKPDSRIHNGQGERLLAFMKQLDADLDRDDEIDRGRMLLTEMLVRETELST